MNMSDLADLARSLHRNKGLTPQQIRNRSGFLDSNNEPYLPIATIQNWLNEGDAAASRRTPISPSPAPIPVTVTPRPSPDGIPQMADHRALHEKVALLEAQLQRLSFERASRTPSPARSATVSPLSPGRSRAHSLIAEQLDSPMETIAQLTKLNSELVAQLTASNQLFTAALGAMDRRDSAPPVGSMAVKPYKDWLPQVGPFSGEPDRSPEAFLTQYYLYARNIPASERTRQLIGKLTGSAQNWYTLTFGNDIDATEAQIALGLRKAFGQEYAGVWALRAMYHVQPHPTQTGAQRLLALDQREEQARQYRVPKDAGPCETRFSRVLALFLPDELAPFLGELTADPRCSEEALRQLEETPAAGGTLDATGRASLAPTSPARELLFAARVQLAEAALRRLQAPSRGAPRARLARTEGVPEPPSDPSPEARPFPASTAALPPPASPPSPTSLPDDYVARCCRVSAEHAAQSAGTDFVGPPHYFGDNEDSNRKTKNQAEMKRRRAGGYCFKCRMSDVREIPFLECPLHGASASNPNAPSVGRTRNPRAQKRA